MAERLLCIYSRKVLVAQGETWETEIQFMEVVRKKKKKKIDISLMMWPLKRAGTRQLQVRGHRSTGSPAQGAGHPSRNPDLCGIPQQIVPQFVLTELLHQAVPPALLPFPPSPCPCSQAVALTR